MKVIRTTRGALAPKMKPNWAGVFETFGHWVNTASRSIGEDVCPLDDLGHVQRAVCVDSKGRRVQCGANFERARDEDTFPVYYFWNCEAA